MSKKDYQAVADALNDLRASFTQDNSPTSRMATLHTMARALCRVFEKDNPRFDEDKFLAACGLIWTKPKGMK